MASSSYHGAFVLEPNSLSLLLPEKRFNRQEEVNKCLLDAHTHEQGTVSALRGRKSFSLVIGTSAKAGVRLPSGTSPASSYSICASYDADSVFLLQLWLECGQVEPRLKGCLSLPLRTCPVRFTRVKAREGLM